MTTDAEVAAMLTVALEEARLGLAEGGIPDRGGAVRPGRQATGARPQPPGTGDGDPSMHAETAAFRAAGRLRGYQRMTMVTTLSPCWYCSGLVRQFGIGHVVVGESVTFHGDLPRRP